MEMAVDDVDYGLLCLFANGFEYLPGLFFITTGVDDDDPILRGDKGRVGAVAGLVSTIQKILGSASISFALPAANTALTPLIHTRKPTHKQLKNRIAQIVSFPFFD